MDDATRRHIDAQPVCQSCGERHATPNGYRECAGLQEAPAPNPLEQIETMHGITGMASMTGVYYEGLVAAGFTEAQALHLTGVWLAAVIAK